MGVDDSIYQRFKKQLEEEQVRSGRPKLKDLYDRLLEQHHEPVPLNLCRYCGEPLVYGEELADDEEYGTIHKACTEDNLGPLPKPRPPMRLQDPRPYF